MTFGRLVRKIQILKQNLEGKLTTKYKVIMVCDQLHNFIIGSDEPFGGKDARGYDSNNKDKNIHKEGVPSGMA